MIGHEILNVRRMLSTHVSKCNMNVRTQSVNDGKCVNVKQHLLKKNIHTQHDFFWRKSWSALLQYIKYNIHTTENIASCMVIHSDRVKS